MKLTSLILFCLVALAYGTEKIFIPLAPESVKFISSQTIKSSQLGDVVSSMLGFAVKPEDPWNSLSPMNPFKVPKTTIVLDFDGFDGDTTLDVPGQSFPLDNDASMQKQLELLSERTLERFSDQEPVVVYMKTGDKLYGAKMAYPELLLPVSPEVDSRLKDAVKDADLVKLFRDGTFNASLPGDDLFLVELHTARLVIDQLAKKASKGSAPSVVWLRLSGLRHIVDRYTDESYQASHALRLIRELVERTKKMLKENYGQKALLLVVTQNDRSLGLVRRSRSLLAEPEPAKEPLMAVEDTWNLAYPWNEDFHVAFVIIAFLVILMALSIFGISVGLWFMDPGRDSIIYRMTSQRMKKD
uniref:Putative renin receptor-like isoform 1 n=1 Tax=Ixodes scapularis TaxID=6945 RepID=A0A4D5RQM5_IXOSC